MKHELIERGPVGVLLEWRWHTTTFASLMVGRVELAQISNSSTTNDWFYTLRFTKNGERSAGSKENKAAAMTLCIDYATNILWVGGASDG